MNWTGYKKLDIITLLGVEETVEWCNSFGLVPKANGKVRLCLDPARLNKALIRPVHRGPMLNDILPRLNNVKYMSIIDASSGFWYWYKLLPFGAVPVGELFQCKIDEIFIDMPNVFGITDDILIIGYDKNGADHDAVVHKVLQR